MIKKHSSQRPLEIEVLYQKLFKTAQNQIAAETDPAKRARWIAALEKMQSAGGGGGGAAGLENFLGLTDTASKQLKESLDKAKSSGLTQQDIEDSAELIKSVGGAGLQQMAGQAQTSSAKDGRSKKKKIKIKRKAINKYIDNFFKKFSALKTEESKISFVVKSGVFTEDDFIKIGLNEIGKDLIKKGRVKEGERLVKISQTVDDLFEELSRESPITLENIAKSRGLELPQKSGKNFRVYKKELANLLANNMAPAPTAPAATAPTATPTATPPAATPPTATPPAATPPTAPPPTAPPPAAKATEEAAESWAAWLGRKGKRVLSSGDDIAKSLTNAFNGGGIKGVLKAGGAGVMKLIGKAIIIWEVIKGLAALATALYAWYNMTSADMKLAEFDNSLIPLFSAEVFKDKVKLMLETIDTDDNSPEKFGALGMLCELSRIFWTRAGDLLAIILDNGLWAIILTVATMITGTGIGLPIAFGVVVILSSFLNTKSLITSAIGGGTAHSVASKAIIDVIAAKAGTGGAGAVIPETPTPEETKTPEPSPPVPTGGVPEESAKTEEEIAKEEEERKAKEEEERKAKEEAAINTIGLGSPIEKSNVVSIPLSSISNNPNAAGKYIGRIKFAPIGRPKYAISLDGSKWFAIPNTSGTKPKTPAIDYLNQLGFISLEDRANLMKSLTALQRQARSERQSLSRSERIKARKQARRVRKGKAA